MKVLATGEAAPTNVPATSRPRTGRISIRCVQRREVVPRASLEREEKSDIAVAPQLAVAIGGRSPVERVPQASAMRRERGVMRWSESYVRNGSATAPPGTAIIDRESRYPDG